MAVTGVILLGFVIGHLVGNLQIYLPNGREAMNAYGAFLRHFLHGWALWVVRGVLLVSVVLHIWAATSLTLESRERAAWVTGNGSGRSRRTPRGRCAGAA